MTKWRSQTVQTQIKLGAVGSGPVSRSILRNNCNEKQIFDTKIIE